MTHKFAEYLQKEFPDWDVDCEYNRKGDATKTLAWRPQSRSDAYAKASTIFPDIIVHHRMVENDNLLVIEAKKSGENDADDRLKLEEFTRVYKYQFGVLLCFDTDREGDVLHELYCQHGAGRVG